MALLGQSDLMKLMIGIDGMRSVIHLHETFTARFGSESPSRP